VLSLIEKVEQNIDQKQAEQMQRKLLDNEFTLEDFRTCAKFASMKRGRAEAILDDVIAAVKRWPEFAEQAKVLPQWREVIAKAQRVALLHG